MTATVPRRRGVPPRHAGAPAEIGVETPYVVKSSSNGKETVVIRRGRDRARLLRVGRAGTGWSSAGGPAPAPGWCPILHVRQALDPRRARPKGSALHDVCKDSRKLAHRPKSKLRNQCAVRNRPPRPAVAIIKK
ncbi:hypothetical protein DIPPA_09028 [Diplonema papillatum]|nr:hypothetical protein DIPPA_09028 [Diplonema papillatum]